SVTSRLPYKSRFRYADPYYEAEIRCGSHGRRADHREVKLLTKRTPKAQNEVVQKDHEGYDEKPYFPLYRSPSKSIYQSVLFTQEISKRYSCIFKFSLKYASCCVI